MASAGEEERERKRERKRKREWERRRPDPITEESSPSRRHDLPYRTDPACGGTRDGDGVRVTQRDLGSRGELLGAREAVGPNTVDRELRGCSTAPVHRVHLRSSDGDAFRRMDPAGVGEERGGLRRRHRSATASCGPTTATSGRGPRLARKGTHAIVFDGVEEGEAVTADARGRRLGHVHRRSDRNSSVHRVPAALQHVHAHLRRDWLRNHRSKNSCCNWGGSARLRWGGGACLLQRTWVQATIPRVARTGERRA